MILKYISLLTASMILSLLSLSCNNFLEVSPSSKLGSTNVYNNDNSASSVLTGIYVRMIESNSNFSSGTQSINLLLGLSADELSNYTTNTMQLQFYQNNVSSTNVPFWNELYKYIYSSNDVLEGINKSSALTLSAKKRIEGEARFIRAFCYHYLVLLFGDVPLITNTYYNENKNMARSDKKIVTNYIIEELKIAKSLLPSEYINQNGQPINERTRPNKFTASALLARIYIYNNMWAEAVDESTNIINENSIFSLELDLNKVFEMSSKEAIWQLQALNNGFNTWDATVYILTNGPNAYSNPVALSNNFINKFSLTDLRLKNWINVDSSTGTKYYYPYKYKIYSYGSPVVEYTMVFRVAEQYLIRSEAFANLNQLANASVDLNSIRIRAGLPSKTYTNKFDILLDLKKQREFELFTEWGHRWFDLIRYNEIDEVMETIAPDKGASWNPTKKILPIPLTEIEANKNLTQNDGY